MSDAIELFIAGLVLGASACMFYCVPILTLYVAGTREGWREGLKATLIFSFSRLLAYVLLGLVAGNRQLVPLKYLPIQCYCIKPLLDRLKSHSGGLVQDHAAVLVLLD